MAATMNIDILQALYDSEINCEIRWIWDGSIDWKLFGKRLFMAMRLP